jgi:Tfp pilus assembly protein PilN
VDSNFVDTPRLSAGRARRALARHVSILLANISICVCAGCMLNRDLSISRLHESSGPIADVDRLSQCQKELGEIERVAEALRDSRVSLFEPYRILHLLSESAPEGVRLKSIQARRRHVEVTGRAITEEELRTFVEWLEARDIVETVTVLSSLAKGDTDDERVSFRLLINMGVIGPKVVSG